MKRYLLIATALAGLSGPALAGPCTDRIAGLEKSLSASDAGSGPTKPMATSTGSTTPTVPKAGETPGTGGTAGMNAAVGSKATSPADVQAQTQGTPTASQGGTATNSAQVSDAMRTAKTADQNGDAAGCGRALDEAERLMKN